MLVGGAAVVVTAGAAYAAVLGDWRALVGCLCCAVAVVVGGVIAHHLPGSPVAPALAWTSACVALVSAHVGALEALPWSSGAWPVNLAGLLVLLLVFPSGPAPGPAWRFLPWAFAAATAGMVAAQWGARQEDGVVVGGPDAPWVATLAVD